MLKHIEDAEAHNISELARIRDAQPQRIKVCADFVWEKEDRNSYHFLPRERGINGVFECERVSPPDPNALEASLDANSAEVVRILCRWITDGHDATFELAPGRWAAVRFCELFLAAVWRVQRQRELAHDQAGEWKLLNTDHAQQWGNGPITLPVPCVIGYTLEGNTKSLGTDRPAVMWSRQWHLAEDPITALCSRITRFFEVLPADSGAGSKDPATQATVIKVARGLVRKLAALCGKKPLTYELIEREVAKLHQEHVAKTGRLDAAQSRAFCEALGRELKGKQGKLCSKLTEIMNQVPEHSMFEQAAASFEPEQILAKDYHGYPVALELRFGSGMVRVLPMGFNLPADAVAAGDERLHIAAIDAKLSLLFRLSNKEDKHTKDDLLISEYAKQHKVGVDKIETCLEIARADYHDACHTGRSRWLKKAPSVHQAYLSGNKPTEKQIKTHAVSLKRRLNRAHAALKHPPAKKTHPKSGK